jgi:transcriptional regulator with XRE-family HTH domain
MLTRNEARRELKNKGWSQRKAAEALGVSLGHLAKVLCGDRDSRRVRLAIEALPESPEGRRMSGFAVKTYRPGKNAGGCK